MTMPDERYRSLISGLSLLQDLLDPRKTPRVPQSIRQQARHVLRHYPSRYEFEMLAENSPNLLDVLSFSDRLRQTQLSKKEHD